MILLVGVVLGVWSLSGSMQTLMWGLNVAFQRQETRGFVRRRLIALAMVGCTLVAFAIVFVLFVARSAAFALGGRAPRLQALSRARFGR